MSAALLATSGNGKPRPHPEPLQLEVYTGGEKELYVTATLIQGSTEGLLVDTQFHDDAVAKLVSEVAARKLRLKAIFITHPDGDHYGGIGAFKAAFPETPIYMTRRALEQFKSKVNPARHLPIPEVLPSSRMTVDGQTVIFINDLQGDLGAVAANTPIWIPSSRTLVADDLVFRGVHPWLGESTPKMREAWRKALRRLAALRPRRIIPGHRFGHERNSPADDIAFNDRYIVAFGETTKTAPDAAAFMQAMERRFPNLKGRLLLEYGAKYMYEAHKQP